jgi:hypothetical protein
MINNLLWALLGFYLGGVGLFYWMERELCRDCVICETKFQTFQDALFWPLILIMMLFGAL